jgi:cytochrome o ubiquinol oxidase subunit 2
MSDHKKKTFRLVLLTITLLAAVTGALLLLGWYLSSQNVQVLNPKGEVGLEQRNLMLFTAILSIIVIVPVFSIAIFIAFKYREDNPNSKYTPEWDSNKKIEAIWWGIPVLLIIIIATVTWITTHRLDPYKPIDSDKNPLVIQVVALDWKWLFIYPEQKIASVNFAQFPVDRSVDFEITADAPMNSFWIPQLGGQIYAMPGMTTHQHLKASEVGDYRGSSANISGEGFAGMKFTAKATSNEDFVNWIEKTKNSSEPLTSETYKELAKQSKNNPVSYYGSVDASLFTNILMKYMNHGGDAGSIPTQSPDHKNHDMTDMNPNLQLETQQ